MAPSLFGVDLTQIAASTEKAYTSGSWRELPIKECNEPLIEVPAKYCYPFYAREMNLSQDKRIFLRGTVLKMFLMAYGLLKNHGYDLIIYDGWRSVVLQENLFWYYLKAFTAAKFNLVDHFSTANTSSEIKTAFDNLPSQLREKVKEANRMYVSWPSSDPFRPSPHVTGGSIDVMLSCEGSLVDLGVPFDWMEDNAGAFYHMKTQRVKFKNDLVVCRNREFLLSAMIKSGFSCYPPEIWHFNFGNQMDSLVTGNLAQYSYVEP